jgi:tRNA (guanine37-N1)-methyltransferase
MAQEWSQTDGLIFLCGRFEGVDERIISHYNITEVSLGDFILCGGDVAAMAMIETTVRLLPDTVGDKVSLDDESFVDNLLEYPSDWNGYKVPDVLLSGNHRAIAQWRSEQAEKRTYERRPDLWNKYCHLKKTDK